MNRPQENDENNVTQRENLESIAPHEEIISLQAASWSGPLPAPGDLEHYERILPGTANRILKIVEREQAHQHNKETIVLQQAGKIIEIDQKVAAGESRRAGYGIASGLVISLLTIGGGIYLIATGHDWAGLTLAGINFTGLAGVFVYGARIRRGERRHDTEQP